MLVVGSRLLLFILILHPLHEYIIELLSILALSK